MAAIRVGGVGVGGGRGAGIKLGDVDELLRARGGLAAAAAARAAPAPALTTMWQGVRSGQADAFFALQRTAPDLVTVKDDGGATALHWFALRGEDDNCRRALALGSQVRAAVGA